MHRTSFWGIALAWFAAPVWSATTYCDGTQISVTTRDSSYAKLTCEAVQMANDIFAQCGIPRVTGPLKIDLVTQMKDTCIALYHCGENWIEILEPGLMQARRSTDGAFSFLDPEAHYQSVVVHELAHFAFDEVPCPFETCMASNEYVAYAMQIMALSPEGQQDFDRLSGIDGPVSRDELSAIILLMAPDRFAQKVWAHLSQQSHPCVFIGQIMDGTVLFDREPFW